MRKPRVRILSLGSCLVLALFIAACGSTPNNVASSCSKTWKVGLVTDVGKLSDKSFNYDSYQGVVKAQQDSSLCVQGKAVESSSEDDYPKNIGLFVDQKYDVIVTVGFKLGDATIAAAKANPSIKFIMVDFADFSDTTPPPNLLGLLFKEDQPGYLAGVLAGSLTKTNTLGVVAGLQSVPPVVHYVEGFKNGAKSVNSGVTVLTIYQPESGAKDFNDPDWGKQQANTFFGQGADIVFGVGGNTGNGALVAAKEKSKMCIGVDVDQFLSYPEVDSCLITSAEKHLDVAVKSAIADVVHSSFKPGIKTFDITNDGIGLAPYHDWDSKIPADVKAKVTQAESGLKNGSITTGVTS